jgi:hypothetical protein
MPPFPYHWNQDRLHLTEEEKYSTRYSYVHTFFNATAPYFLRAALPTPLFPRRPRPNNTVNQDDGEPSGLFRGRLLEDAFLRGG